MGDFPSWVRKSGSMFLLLLGLNPHGPLQVSLCSRNMAAPPHNSYTTQWAPVEAVSGSPRKIKVGKNHGGNFLKKGEDPIAEFVFQSSLSLGWN